MKILSASQIYEADQATIKNEPISSVELMERAGHTCFNWLVENNDLTNKKVCIFCGPGNNGGDGLVIGRLLLEQGIEVEVYVLNIFKNRSKDFEFNLSRLDEFKKNIFRINKENDIPDIDEDVLVIDAIFGIGLKRPIEGFTEKLVSRINLSTAKVVSIDVPSGLYIDKVVPKNRAVVRASYVLTFQTVKLAFLLAQNQDYIGLWRVLDIGLDVDFIKNAKSPYNLVQMKELKRIYKKRARFSHKGTFGHSLIIGGSFGKVGAVILASKAALKAGAGLVSAYIPKCGYSAMQATNPEVMVEVDDEKFVQFFNFKTKPTAIGVGPGLGTHLKTKKGFVDFYSKCKVPLVIDADGLNIISEFEELKKIIPKNCVLTPHPKEFERLVGPWTDDYHKLEKLSEFATKYKCVVILKGAYTAIAFEDKVWFNQSGNSALATAGSGDVLTGIITSFLAQGYSSLEAALLAVHCHGRSADLGMQHSESEESFIASNIFDYLGMAFKELKE